MRRRRQHLRTPLVAVAAAWAVGGGAGWAFSASNTVAASNAGQGSQPISAYTVGNIAYGLNVNSPQNIDRVTFTISPTNATTVKIKLAGTWYACTNTAGSVSCATTSPQANVNTANGTNLTLVATQ